MENIVLTVDADGIALLELNRPAALNALGTPLMREVRGALQKLAVGGQARALVITGRGRAFCAGADLNTEVLLADPGEGPSIGQRVAEEMRREFNPMMELIYGFPLPVVTAINGIAAGGGAGLALCADLVLASESAALKVVQAQQLSIVADLGANWLLSRITGRTRAMGMCLLGETIQAATLREWGLVWECLQPDDLLPGAREYAKRLASVPAETVLATRRLVDTAMRGGFGETLESERLWQRALCDSPLFLERVKGFTGRQRPK